jgi:hypothetical protein
MTETHSAACHLAPSLDALLVRAYEDGAITLSVHPDGMFDEEAFLLSRKLSILQRWGLIDQLESEWSTSDGHARYALSSAGREFVELQVM